MKRLALLLLLAVLAPAAIAGVIFGNPADGLRPTLALRQQLLAGRPALAIGQPGGWHAELRLPPQAPRLRLGHGDLTLLDLAP